MLLALAARAGSPRQALHVGRRGRGSWARRLVLEPGDDGRL